MTFVRRFGAAFLLLALAGCARGPVEAPRLEPGSVRERYTTALAAREAQARSAEGEISLWARSSATGPLPAVSARFVLAGPGMFRVRVASLFGTALDLFAAQDSVVVWAPAQRRALVMPAAGDSIGVRGIGVLGCRFWSAAWSPPDAAWSAATREDSSLVLHWKEDRDSVHVAVGSGGLPVRVRVEPFDGKAVLARYEAWTAEEGVWWPTVATCEDDAGSFGVTCKVQRIKFQRAVDPERFRIPITDRTRIMTVAELGEAIQRIAPR